MSTGEQPMSGEVEAARQDALYAADHARPAAVDALIAAVRADEQERERAEGFFEGTAAMGRYYEDAKDALETSRREAEALRAALEMLPPTPDEVADRLPEGPVGRVLSALLLLQSAGFLEVEEERVVQCEQCGALNDPARGPEEHEAGCALEEGASE